jgi:branched-chain amino acid transport system ATP-binding protein
MTTVNAPSPAAGADHILVARNLSKDFNGFVAVDDINLSFERGKIHALIGPNGAGKTTFFNLLTKFLQPSSGQIVFNGRDITALAPAHTARLGLVRSFQISAIFANMSVRENVRVALQRRTGIASNFWTSETTLSSLNDRSDELLDAVDLLAHRHDLAAELPYGKKRALEIATTLALDPELMLLDEPTAGMDRAGTQAIIELVRKVAAQRTVLMVEHNMSVVSSLSDTICVLARGRIVAQGVYAEVSRNPLVIEAYLGEGHA